MKFTEPQAAWKPKLKRATLMAQYRFLLENVTALHLAICLGRERFGFGQADVNKAKARYKEVLVETRAVADQLRELQ